MIGYTPVDAGIMSGLESTVVGQRYELWGLIAGGDQAPVYTKVCDHGRSGRSNL
jgi:hypothetical protein